VISDAEKAHIQRAVELAHEAEGEGNLPIGAVIVLDGVRVGEGHNRIAIPVYNPGRHAEIEAIRSVPLEYWPRAREMTCYTTLEPCVMCLGTLVLHGVGRVVFGGIDRAGGSSITLAHLPEYYATGGKPEWIGPVLPDVCDPLYDRVAELFPHLPCGQV